MQLILRMVLFWKALSVDCHPMAPASNSKSVCDSDREMHNVPHEMPNSSQYWCDYRYVHSCCCCQAFLSFVCAAVVCLCLALLRQKVALFILSEICQQTALTPLSKRKRTHHPTGLLGNAKEKCGPVPTTHPDENYCGWCWLCHLIQFAKW